MGFQNFAIYRLVPPFSSLGALKLCLCTVIRSLTRCIVDLLPPNNMNNKKAVLPQGNRAMPQVFFSVEVRQQHSLQV